MLCFFALGNFFLLGTFRTTLFTSFRHFSVLAHCIFDGGTCESFLKRIRITCGTCIGTQGILVIVYGVWRIVMSRTTETEYAKNNIKSIFWLMNHFLVYLKFILCLQRRRLKSS